MNIRDLQYVCHQQSKEAGWWNDLQTGEPLLNNKSIVPEKLCLIHSEVSEAYEGIEKALMDDKLPHRPMVEVELADAVIRMFDLCGALNIDLEDVVNDVRRLQLFERAYLTSIIAQIHYLISQAMEGYRKNKAAEIATHRSQFEVSLAKAYLTICQMATTLGLDLEGAIREKMSFNAVRPDHKVENRKKPGGKSF